MKKQGDPNEKALQKLADDVRVDIHIVDRTMTKESRNTALDLIQRNALARYKRLKQTN